MDKDKGKAKKGMTGEEAPPTAAAHPAAAGSQQGEASASNQEEAERKALLEQLSLADLKNLVSLAKKKGAQGDAASSGREEDKSKSKGKELERKGQKQRKQKEKEDQEPSDDEDEVEETNTLSQTSSKAEKERKMDHKVLQAITMLLKDKAPKFADEVGLGKTIEAGLLIQQLVDQNPAGSRRQCDALGAGRGGAGRGRPT